MALSIPNLPSITGILNIPGISTGLLAFLQTHGYWIMFFIMIVEGPIVTYVAAFASSLGIFNIYLVLLLSILGNIAGDAFLFFIGRMGKKLAVEKYARRFIGKDRIDRIEKYLKSNPGKTLVVIKLTPPLPVPGLIISGALNIPSKTFFFYSIIISLIYSLLFSILGFYSAFDTIANYVKYSEILIGIAVIAVILVWMFLRYIPKKISKRIEEV